MKNAAWILAFRVLVAVTGSSSEETADCGSVPTRSLPNFKCTISPKSSRSCSFEDTDQRALSACDDGPCYAWTGMQLNVSCDGDDSHIFFRGNSTLSGQFILWPFASTSAEGLYECRSDNGSLVANRSVIIDGELLLLLTSLIFPSTLPPRRCVCDSRQYTILSVVHKKHCSWLQVQCT